MKCSTAYRSLRDLAVVVVMLTALGCAPPPPKGPPKTLTTHPRALDRYARLRMRELVDSDPVAVHRLASCEADRILDAFGGKEGRLRMMGVDDSVHGTPAARARFDAVEQQFFGKGFEGSGPFCEPLKAIANREDPIAPVDNAITKWRPQTLTTHPRAFDRYVRLRMRELVAADPVAVRREVQCEMDRLDRAFGSEETDLRMKSANDSLYRTPALRARRDTVDAILHGRGFQIGEPWCQALKAIANREDPIASVDSAIRNP